MLTHNLSHEPKAVPNKPLNRPPAPCETQGAITGLEALGRRRLAGISSPPHDVGNPSDLVDRIYELRTLLVEG